MCRFYSGLFFRHELMLKYDYFMRLDSHVNFPCEMEQDPFAYLKAKNQLYGFIITMKEKHEYIPSLHATIRKWLEHDNIARVNKSYMINSYNVKLFESLCIVYNNFEVGSLAAMRSSTYLDYFDYLDKAGGFYYERWGDAPVRTYYMMLMLKGQTLRFKDIAYKHYWYFNKPNNKMLLDKCNKVLKASHFSYPQRLHYQCTHLWDSTMN